MHGYDFKDVTIKEFHFQANYSVREHDFPGVGGGGGGGGQTESATELQSVG